MNIPFIFSVVSGVTVSRFYYASRMGMFYCTKGLMSNRADTGGRGTVPRYSPSPGSNSTYVAVYAGIVPHVVAEVEWTTPVFLSGYLATSSIAGSILQAVCLAAGVFIYLPFLRLFEEQKERQMVKNVKELTAELQRQEEENAIMPLTKRRDTLGGTAKVLAEDLKDALRGRKLFFLYQPQMNTEGKCIGAEALDKMRRLKEKGHKFLIDDFGMGHTSLVYLQTNYFSVVKLDGSLTKDVMENELNRWL